MAYKDLSVKERHAIIRAGVVNGIHRLADIEARYDDFTDPAKHPDYDIESYVRENPSAIFNHDGHYPDTYKLPNHPTFSTGSRYHSEATPGGRWSEDGKVYEPSDYVLNQQGGWNNFLRNFQGQEQGTGAVPVFRGGVMLPEVEVHLQANGGYLAPTKSIPNTPQSVYFSSKNTSTYGSQVPVHRFEDGGEQSLSTEQPVVVMPITGEKADTSWYEWWLANRQKQLQHNLEDYRNHRKNTDYLGHILTSYPSPEKYGKSIIDNLASFTEYAGRSIENNPEAMHLARIAFQQHQPFDISDWDDSTVNIGLAHYIDGTTFPFQNVILYPGWDDGVTRTAVTHERAHALKPYIQEGLINTFTKRKDIHPEEYDSKLKRFLHGSGEQGVGIQPTSGKRDSYLDSADEVYARLMQFRQFVDANPLYTWTEEDLKKYRPALYKFNLLRYSNKDLLRLLNEIAQNTKSFDQGNEAYLAAQGGPIHIAPSNPLIGKKYYKDGGVLEGDFDVDALTYEEIKELDRLGYTVERL